MGGARLQHMAATITDRGIEFVVQFARLASLRENILDVAFKRQRRLFGSKPSVRYAVPRNQKLCEIPLDKIPVAIIIPFQRRHHRAKRNAHVSGNEGASADPQANLPSTFSTGTQTFCSVPPEMR